jgi:hypothetical protein
VGNRKCHHLLRAVLGNIGRHRLGHRPPSLVGTAGAVLPAPLIAKGLARVDVAAPVSDERRSLVGVSLAAVHRQDGADHGRAIRVCGQVVGQAAGAYRLGLLGVADEPDPSVLAPCDGSEHDFCFQGR